MTCGLVGNLIYTRGSVEHLTALIEAEVDLDTQVVEFSWDHGITWVPATWIGPVGTSREAELLVNFGTLYTGKYKLLGRVTDSPAVPWIDLGEFTVVAA